VDRRKEGVDDNEIRQRTDLLFERAKQIWHGRPSRPLRTGWKGRETEHMTTTTILNNVEDRHPRAQQLMAPELWDCADEEHRSVATRARSLQRVPPMARRNPDAPLSSAWSGSETRRTTPTSSRSMSR